MRPNDKLLELDDDDVPPFDQEWWGSRDPEVERAFDAACLVLSRARRREDKLLALRSGVEALKKFDDYGTAIRDLGARAVTYGMRLADIKSVIGQDFEDPPDAIGDEIDELDDVDDEPVIEDHDLADADLDVDLRAIRWGVARGQPHTWIGPPLPIDVAELLERHRGTTRFAVHFMQHPHRVAEMVPYVTDEDFPADLLPIIHAYALVAVSDPMKAADLWVKHHDVFSALWEPLLQEHIERSGAIEQPPRQVEREVPAPSETAATARIEQASPPPPPLVPTAPHDAAEQDHPPPDPIDIAIGFARYGWPVFPCDPRTKHPLTPRDKDPKTGEPIDGTGGFKKATTDIETIRAWWTEHPNAMVGIPTGEIIGAFVLEIDISDKATGITYTSIGAQIAAVEAELGAKLPPTYQVRTPRGGAHLFFRSESGYPRSYASIKRAGKQLRGIDIRADGGYVISSGSIRYDGVAYVCVDKRKIAQAPIELVDWACGRGRWTPQEAPPPESGTTTAAEKPSGTTFGTRKAPSETCERWAAAALEGNASELAGARPGTRNNLANILAYRMGRMVASGWIPERTVIDAFLAASHANGKIVDDGGPEKIRATIESGLAAGKRKPLTHLPDRPKHPWQPIDGDDDTVWLRCLRSEIRALYRMRFPSNPVAAAAADERLIEIIQISADPWVIGREVRLLDVEYRRLADEPHGRRRGARLPGKMKPCDVGREVVDAYRNARKLAQNRITQAKKRAADKAELAAIDDLDDRASVVLTFLRRAKTPPKTTAQIMNGVKRSRVFAKLKRKSLRNAVLRLLEPSSPIYGLVTQTVGVAKNGRPTKLVTARRESDPETPTEAQP